MSGVPTSLNKRIGRRLHGGRVAHVSLIQPRIQAGRDGLQAVDAAPGQPQLRALRAVVPRQRRAEAGTGAGDKDPSLFKTFERRGKPNLTSRPCWRARRVP
jgi:hypothetical protein